MAKESQTNLSSVDDKNLKAVKTEVKGDQRNESFTANEKTQKIEITNLSDAISVLIQAAEIGRANGAYNWEELEIIGKSINFIKSQSKQNQ